MKEQCPRCGYHEVEPTDQIKTISLGPWWSGKTMSVEVTKSHMTGQEILDLMRKQGQQVPPEGREVLMEELPNGTARIIRRQEQTPIYAGMKLSTIEANDND